MHIIESILKGTLLQSELGTLPKYQKPLKIGLMGNTRICEWVGGLVGEWMDGWMDGWIGWMDGLDGIRVVVGIEHLTVLITISHINPTK